MTPQLNRWSAQNAALGWPSILSTHALGKAQRILANLDSAIGSILTHRAIKNTSEILRAQGYALPAAGWDTPTTKAYSGLTDAAFRQITAGVRKNTLRRFGPVRQVPPTNVFEIAFEGIAASSHHTSGVALRFPRMLRWRHDRSVKSANTLDDLREMLRLYWA